ncbi:MAG: magnesium transporter [Candidatus Babeliales bacterium]
MNYKELFARAYQNLEAIKQETPEGIALWQELTALHPADSADFFSDLSDRDLQDLFVRLRRDLQVGIFSHVSESLKVYILSFLSDNEREQLLAEIPLDELTDLFEELSDADLERYLPLLSKKDRKQVVALMKFDPESAGGIMDTEVLTLMQDFTVAKSIHLLQRLQPRKELHHIIYVTNQDNQLVGYIMIESLVLQKPEVRLSQFMHKPTLVIDVLEDREEVARIMMHYDATFAPVVGENNYFLGVIQGDTLVDIIAQEASEDVYHMSAMPAIKDTYFETPFFKILFERSYILIILLLAQSVSSMILERYSALACGYVFFNLFLTMLVSAGGNSSSQTSALVIQGMASGEIHPGTIRRFLTREFAMSVMLACILGVVAFGRAYFTIGALIPSLAVSISLSLIVLVSVALGSCMPLILQKLRIDPAFAAGPFLATLMDICGLFIYTQVCTFFLG